MLTLLTLDIVESMHNLKWTASVKIKCENKMHH